MMTTTIRMIDKAGARPLVQRFWRAMSALAAVVIAYTGLSWYYLYAHHTRLLIPTSRAELLSIPTGFPSIWNVVRVDASGFLLPFFILIVQVFLTGGFYGVLIRVNTGQRADVASFTADAARSFWRLLLWNILWAAIAILGAGLMRVSTGFSVPFTALLLLSRFVFLYGDIALVCERDIRFALKSAAGALLGGWLRMLPFALFIMILTGIATSLFGSAVTFGVLVLSLAYGLAMTWVLHMITARYVFFSEWSARNPAAVSA